MKENKITLENISNDETTKIFDQAKPFLSKINITGTKTQEELFQLFLSGRFVDIRVRVDGREYYFEGEGLRRKVNDMRDEIKKLKTPLANRVLNRIQEIVTPKEKFEQNKQSPEKETKK